MFVHQTDRVIAKQGGRISTSRPRKSLTVSATELGMAYFFGIRVLHTSSSSNVACTSVVEGCLTACMQALGLTAHATVTGQAHTLDLAREVYENAISEVNAVLRSGTV
jgi:hypothetical protein